ncbi:MAG TPA: tRNA (adenosine(37)-N6)-threonylcarbamoyltransferase complex dimerization subunit type 1 TsaB [Thermoanaerobaculia bacterium]|jgi:tRNA threonylcarbamoyl adenosine modification protein YeaZ
MLILAADTSLPIFSVALLRDRTLLGAVALEGRSSRNEKLLPAVDWLLTESGIDRHEIDLFAVTRGPGSFTGVRIGLATIQGLALALGKPICAMSTHEAIALGEGSGPGALPGLERIAVIDDAGRGEFYVSRFEGHRETEPPHLAKEVERDAVVLAIEVGDFLQHGNVAAACARRADELARANALDRYIDVTPIYVRLAEAEVKLQQKNG